MHDSKKVVIGIVVFLAVAAFPFVWSIAFGEPAQRPELAKPNGGPTCVEDTDYMRNWHMDLLDDWRNDVVRNGKRIYVAKNGKRYEMSLSMTCLRCHNDRDKFCNRCHNYMGIEPTCFHCHVDAQR